MKRLREGFTTGSAAAAAAKAALLFLMKGKRSKRVGVPLPMGGRLNIPVCSIEMRGSGVRATVVKDAGDDPDVTHHAVIGATVFRLKRGEGIVIEGGSGVGRVTRSGLSVQIGEAAINPAPRRQIAEALAEVLEQGIGAVRVVIDVEKGEKIARKTLNPRLGIVGGISILGTRGTVKPFSHEAYRETIRVSMDVAKESGSETIGLSTGGKSEGFLRRLRSDLPEVSFLQVADFFSFSLKEAAGRGFRELLYGCFFGKLIKMAQGHEYTHAKKSRIDFYALAEWCKNFGMREEQIRKIEKANTAREALSLIKAENRSGKILAYVIEKAVQSARRYAGPGPGLCFYLFDLDGSLLASSSSPSRKNARTIPGEERSCIRSAS